MDDFLLAGLLGDKLWEQGVETMHNTTIGQTGEL